MFGRKKIYTEKEIDVLLDDCIREKPDAQRALIKCYLPFAKSVAMRYAGDVMEAEEIVDDSFLKVFQNLHRFDRAQPFKAWLRTIVVHTAIDAIRRNKKFEGHVGLENIDLPDPSEDIFSRISAAEILKLVQKLPPSYRLVFTLYVIEGYNHREIAEKLGIREGTSKSNLQDARIKLKLLIKEAYPQWYLAYTLNQTKSNEN